MEETVTVGTRFPLTIKRLDINGAGIGYYKHKICFLPDALPGEVVVAEVTKVHDRYLEAKVHKHRKLSPNRVKPVDPLYGKVGGIELGALAYPQQLKFKSDIVSESLAKFKPSGWQDMDVRPTIGAEHETHYRNKAQFPVRVIDGHVRAGLYEPGSHTLVPLSKFATQRPLTMQLMNQLCKTIEDLDIPVYDEKQNSGIIKTLVIRESVATGEAQLTIITNSPKLPRKRDLLAAIATQMPAIVSVSQNINPGRGSLIWGKETNLLAGQPTITERINGRDFALSPQAFLQLNPEQTGKLYKLALDALNLQKGDKLVDAYCGVGTLGLSMAHVAGSVRGMDTIPAAIDDAKANAAANDITNADYEVGKAEDLLPRWIGQGYRPDAVIVDPPRTGLERPFINALLKARPEKFVYISCNPSTLARDLQLLTRVYKVNFIQSIDMFPQTARCEAVVSFTRK
ncbi:23S rRNA (uracil(1939)-C(5))-methyltransferase RlmD [Lacticaseibacillus pabuli]|uniref:23S rRNA (Uracil(1939)-C(5))-methyltransferase RlmD n=1 Tax=Lacticaseibacillus pabuli TaxID=3025672 RepID=A0ABY7WWX6_9LACO|nr:23S rRNA (uracil(1939)-C(5))-methyltransferase RlmD [Lacticaseibacillus sp. KACC 23028]WDF83496.1 23S rRNA (uracil(1939)-C(5))-methyltransferase RlmD [Lacticaseibacillus sp. KACC 23028]